ncbi:unnamed protein product, partial [marine sediment metagenome]
KRCKTYLSYQFLSIVSKYLKKVHDIAINIVVCFNGGGFSVK